MKDCLLSLSTSLYAEKEHSISTETKGAYKYKLSILRVTRDISTWKFIDESVIHLAQVSVADVLDEDLITFFLENIAIPPSNFTHFCMYFFDDFNL